MLEARAERVIARFVGARTCVEGDVISSNRAVDTARSRPRDAPTGRKKKSKEGKERQTNKKGSKVTVKALAQKH